MNWILKIVCGLLIWGGWSAVQAGPAKPGLMECRQPDGSVVSARLCGDERFSYWLSAEGIPLLRCTDGFFRYAEWVGDSLQATEVCARDAGYRDEYEAAYVSRLERENKAGRMAVVRAEKARRSVLASSRRDAVSMRKAGKPDIALPKQQKALAILVEFPDLGNGGNDYLKFTMPNPRELFTRMLNEKGFDYDGATGSVADYFHESSGGNFSLSFDVYGPVELYYDISFYGTKVNGEELNAWNMAYEACKALDAEVDFSQYDSNGDGMIDNVYIFYAGQSEANGGPEYTVWPHASDVELITGKQFVFDGVRLNHYACSNEMQLVRDPQTREFVPHLQGIGSVCHEFSHVLGLPDLYDVYGAGAFTPGEWSLMDIGSHNNNSHTPPLLSAYERYALGWLQPDVLKAEAGDKVLNPLKENKAYMIPTSDENELFMLENRQQMGWDAYLPGHGMLVWHIDYDEEAWNANRINVDPYHQGIDLVEADEIETSDSRAADAFPGVASVTTWEAAPWSSLGENEEGACRYELSAITEREDGTISFRVNEASGLKAEKQTTILRLSGRLLEVDASLIAGRVVVCDLAGQCLFSSDCGEKVLHFVLPSSGIYLVSADNEKWKICVR